METLPINPEAVLQHHLDALGKNDIEELMKDYSEQSELWTPDGVINGSQAISSFFNYAFTIFPKEKTQLKIKKMIAKDSKVYLIWTAESPIVNVPFTTDCFEIKDGKIIWQSTAFQLT